ncbi:MAG: tetratricopeptide repeat protein [Desulfovibrionaceae bacterium]|nr:tetratricopeptide repeat protein [Desulfovibrionaceae bacterium]
MTATSEHSTAPGARKKLVLALCAGTALILLGSSFLYRLENPTLKEAVPRPAMGSGMPPGMGQGAAGGAAGTAGQAGPEDERMGAVRALMERLSKDPNDVEALREAGKLFLRMGAADKAVALLTRALVARPGDTATLYLMGMAEYAAGDYKEAAGYFEAIVQAEPDNAEAAFNLAMIYRRNLQRPADAQKLLRAVADMEGASADVRKHAREELEKKE